VLDVEEKNRMHGDEVMRLATEGGVIDTTLAKATATEEKLKKMRDLYVADQWDNATELMEWSGFFEGAAIVHWALMRGVVSITPPSVARRMTSSPCMRFFSSTSSTFSSPSASSRAVRPFS